MLLWIISIIKIIKVKYKPILGLIINNSEANGSIKVRLSQKNLEKTGALYLSDNHFVKSKIDE